MSQPHRRPRRRLAALAALAAPALALLGAACTAPATETDAAAGGSADGYGDGAGAVTLTSCGHEIAFDAPPERVVTLDQPSTETLLALGLGDHLAGTANLYTDVAEEYRAEFAEIPVLSPEIPTGEQLREALPDFVVSSFTTMYTRERVGTREELAELGVPTFVSAVDCRDANDPELTAFDRLFQDYARFGEIFGAEREATALVAEQRAAIERAAETRAAVRGEPTVVWLYSVLGGTPYVAGADGMPSDMSRLVGAANAFDDIPEEWPETSFEEIAARDPDVLVVGDLSERGRPGDSAAEKLAMLREHPVAARLTAVAEGRIVEVPGVEMDPSVRSVHTLELLADGLRELGYVG